MTPHGRRVPRKARLIKRPLHVKWKKVVKAIPGFVLQALKITIKAAQHQRMPRIIDELTATSTDILVKAEKPFGSGHADE